MDGWSALPAAWLTALIINLMPAFMPPTWSVLALFRITTGAPLLPLTVGGAAASAAGRVALAAGVALVVCVLRLPWARWLGDSEERTRAGPSQARVSG